VGTQPRHDGTILYSRWDYVDRSNMPFMSLWSVQPDGANARLVYGNYTVSPHCTFEPIAVPRSSKIVFTASGHHAQTMGSLVLLDPSVGTEGDRPDHPVDA
jgi:predicted carbohydrate-binding protein with CBM5 and CBM33 domain